MAENEKETCPNPASITANCKMWRVNSGEYTTDEDSAHWGAFWEPLDVYLPESARPSCCFGDSIVFYDRTGNRLLKDFVRHYNFIGAHPHLLFLEGKWREVISGRCEYRNNHWYMRWAVATNTAMAIEANAAARLAAAERENERLQAFIDALPEKIRKCGEPGPGGINITNGVPSEVYIAIGRDRYDTEYEVAEATAEAVRTNTADSIPRWLAAITPAAEAGQ
jgi:hypothetical protein